MMNEDREQRIRERAFGIWLEEGRPEGRADVHWDMATELIAIEENQLLTLKPVGRAGEPVEPILAVENAGDFPTLTDQGEETAYPTRPEARQDARDVSITVGSTKKPQPKKPSR
jgi:hypothetical protein